MKGKRLNNTLMAALTALLLINLLATGTFAQTAGGTILGKVTDLTGAILPGVAVTIKNVETGITRAVLTGETGVYNAANLQPGIYQVTAELPAFSVGVKKDIKLNVGSEAAIDFQLHIESVTSSVDVTAEETQVDLIASTVNRTVDGSTIRELPLNGRDWIQLATLEPGVTAIAAGGSGGRNGNGAKLTVSGARPSENNFRMDGVSINDNSNSTPGSILGSNLGVEAIREFSIVSNSYSAEYGRSTGAVVNAVTKSGTNALHGDVFYFHRNSALDARNFFDGSEAPPFRRHQFGGSVGGALIKNRTFWFANYEQVQELLARTSISTVLSPNARLGLLSTGAVTVDPSITKTLGLMQLPNAGLLGPGDVGQFSAPTNKLSKGRYALGKIDHNFSASDSLNGSYFFDDANSNSPDSQLTKVTADTSRRQMVSLEYTHIITPQLLNVARFGFYRTTNVSGEITSVLNPLLEDPSLGFVPGQNIGAISVPGISVPGGGPGAINVNKLYFNSFQGNENLYINKGNHSLKVGGNVERMQYNFDIPNLNGGSYSFGTISTFLTNRPSSFGALYPGSDTYRGLRQTLIAGYIQDDYRFKSNLTFNLGMRYEFLTIPKEVNGKVAKLHNLTDTAATVGGPVLDRNPTLRDFSPRVGLVWDPFKTGKTSIRAGFGIFDSLPLVWLYDTPLTRSMPYFVQGVTTAPPVGSYPSGAFPLLQVSDLRTAYIEPEPARAYSMKWNLNIQREVFGWVTDIGYTGSRGVHLPQVERNMNTVIPEQQPDGTWVYPAGKPKLNTNFSTINTTDTWNSDSYYHGLQVSVQKSWRSGIHIQNSYAYAKSIDTASSTGSTAAGSGYSGARAVPTPLLPGLNRGLSDFDMRHSYSFSLVWPLPFARNASGFTGMVAKGWQFGSIVRAQSGLPFSVVLNSDRGGSLTDTTGLALGQGPNLIGVPGCESQINKDNPNNYIKTECFAFPAKGTLGNVGRNTLTRPGITTADFSLFKNFQNSESVKTQFRIEAFNALNHTNFAVPNSVVFDSAGLIPSAAGKITSTSTDSRRIQVGLKVSF
jgi:hypothetical protein